MSVDDIDVGYGRPLPFGIEKIANILNIIGSVVIFTLLVLVNADVIGRNFFLTPIRGTTEITALLIVGVTFIQLPSTIWAGRLTRAEIISDALPKRSRLRMALFAIFHLIGVVAMALLCISLMPKLGRAWELGDYIGSLGDFTAPYWPVRLVQVIGSGLSALILALLFLSNIKILARPRQ